VRVPVIVAEVLDKEPGLTWIWLVYGAIGVLGLFSCRRTARSLALFLPLALLLALPGVAELHDAEVGPQIRSESVSYYIQWHAAIVLALFGPVVGAVYRLRLHPQDRLRTAVWTVTAALALAGLVIAKLMVSGTTAVFLVAPTVRVAANGKPISGWVHREVHGHSVIVTRNDNCKRESYLVVLPTERHGFVRSCGAWTASRFPLVVMRDYNPPCRSWGQPISEPLDPNLVVNRNSIGFTADDGRHLTFHGEVPRFNFGDHLSHPSLRQVLERRARLGQSPLGT